MATIRVAEPAPESVLLNLYTKLVRDNLRATLMETAAKEVESAVDAAMVDMRLSIERAYMHSGPTTMIRVLVERAGGSK